MNNNEVALICKALSDSNRIKIIDMLASGEKCVCNILDEFDISQPTLSHHIRILSECGLINTRKEGKWNHHSLNSETLLGIKSYDSRFDSS